MPGKFFLQANFLTNQAADIALSQLPQAEIADAFRNLDRSATYLRITRLPPKINQIFEDDILPTPELPEGESRLEIVKKYVSYIEVHGSLYRLSLARKVHFRKFNTRIVQAEGDSLYGELRLVPKNFSGDLSDLLAEIEARFYSDNWDMLNFWVYVGEHLYFRWTENDLAKLPMKLDLFHGLALTLFTPMLMSCGSDWNALNTQAHYLYVNAAMHQSPQLLNMSRQFKLSQGVTIKHYIDEESIAHLFTKTPFKQRNLELIFSKYDCKKGTLRMSCLEEIIKNYECLDNEGRVDLIQSSLADEKLLTEIFYPNLVKAQAVVRKWLYRKNQTVSVTKP